MRIIHPENTYALLAPIDQYTFQFFPQVFPIVILKVYWQYILVFFGWIFGILYRTVRPPDKPFRVLFYIGMVGRALYGKIQCYFQSIIGSSFNEMFKIFQCAQVL